MVGLSIGGKTPKTGLSMKEIADKTPYVMMELGKLVERHNTLTNPVERVNVERRIMEKFFAILDFLGKFGTAFLRSVGKRLSDREMQTLYQVYASAKAKDPIKGPILALENIKKKSNMISDDFRHQAEAEMKKYRGLRRYSNEIKKGVHSDVNARLSTIKKQLHQLSNNFKKVQSQANSKGLQTK